MRQMIRLGFLVTVSGLVFGAALAALDSAGRVKVESRDGRFNSVRVRTDGRVQLVLKLSDNDCREGRSWGYDSNRIWVDDGCRAVFVYGRDARNDRWDRDDRYDRDDRWDRDDRYDRNARLLRVRLESEDFRRRSIQIPVRGEVRLSRQISSQACRLGRTWGYSSNSLWVDDGCRADFIVPTR